MTQATLLAAAAFALAAAALYAYVGRQVRRRRVSPEAQRAATLFGVWWLGLAGTTAVGGIQSALAAAGLVTTPLVVTLTYLNIFVICVALWALLYYLLYIFTGRPGILAPLSAFYVAYYVLLVYYITSSRPVGIEVRRWTVQLVYAVPLQGGLFTVVLALLVFPQIIGALAYFTLFFKVRERTQRYRITLVSWAIIVWFGSAFVGASTGASQADDWQLASRAIGLGAALAVLVAYKPPGWLKRRLRVRSIDEEEAPALSAPAAGSASAPHGPGGAGRAPAAEAPGPPSVDERLRRRVQRSAAFPAPPPQPAPQPASS